MLYGCLCLHGKKPFPQIKTTGQLQSLLEVPHWRWSPPLPPGHTGSCCSLSYANSFPVLWAWLRVTLPHCSRSVFPNLEHTSSDSLLRPAENISCLPCYVIQHWRDSLGESAGDMSGDVFKFAWELGLISNEEYIAFFCLQGHGWSAMREH